MPRMRFKFIEPEGGKKFPVSDPGPDKGMKVPVCEPDDSWYRHVVEPDAGRKFPFAEEPAPLA